MVKRLSLLREVILVKTTRVRKVSEFKSSTLHPCPFFSPFVYSSTILFCKKKRSTRWTIYGKNICLKFYDPTVMSPSGWRYRSNCRSQVWLNCSPQTPTSSAITPDFIALLYHSILTPLCYMSNSGALHSADSNTDTTTQWQFFFLTIWSMYIEIWNISPQHLCVSSIFVCFSDSEGHRFCDNCILEYLTSAAVAERPLEAFRALEGKHEEPH